MEEVVIVEPDIGHCEDFNYSYIDCCVDLQAMRRLASQGRTLVCTIHQPSASLFRMFDSLLLLARGAPICLCLCRMHSVAPYRRMQSVPPYR